MDAWVEYYVGVTWSARYAKKKRDIGETYDHFLRDELVNPGQEHLTFLLYAQKLFFPVSGCLFKPYALILPLSRFLSQL
jgi:hypothetical protein